MAELLSEKVSLPAKPKRNKWQVKFIEAGWGSSGYYGAKMLSEYGPRVFKAGTKVYMNHPSLTEEADRPERDLHQLAGKLVSDAVFQENGLFAEIEFYSHYAPIIKEMAGDVGLSIRAYGEAKMGEADGREGPIIEALVENPLTSVDVVTVAGAGGKFISLLESYKAKDEAVTQVAESDMEEGNGMSITKEEFEAAIADLKTTFVEALSPLRESVSILVESAAAEPEEVSETEPVEDAVPALDPVDVAEKFNESGLPKIALKRVAESLKSAENSKTIDELIEDEKAYASSLRESVVAPTSEVVGIVHEASAKSVSTTSDEFDAIVSRIAKKK
jgi:hypothetical protein